EPGRPRRARATADRRTRGSLGGGPASRDPRPPPRRQRRVPRPGRWQVGLGRVAPGAAMSAYLLAEHVADLLGCSVDTVQRRAAANQTPRRRIGGTRRLLFVPDELDAWIDGAPLETVDAPNGGRIVRPVGS